MTSNQGAMLHDESCKNSMRAVDDSANHDAPMSSFGRLSQIFGPPSKGHKANSVFNASDLVGMAEMHLSRLSSKFSTRSLSDDDGETKEAEDEDTSDRGTPSDSGFDTFLSVRVSTFRSNMSFFSERATSFRSDMRTIAPTFMHNIDMLADRMDGFEASLKIRAGR